MDHYSGVVVARLIELWSQRLRRPPYLLDLAPSANNSKIEAAHEKKKFSHEDVHAERSVHLA